MHRAAWALVPDTEIAAICDAAPAARAQARAHGIPVFAAPAEMLAEARLDAVTVCTPPVTHATLTIEALERGLHVLCEKPLALTTRDALRMLNTASHRQRTLLLATKFRHVPALVTARKMLAAGVLGEPVAFEVTLCSAVDMTQRWNAQPAHSGGGVLVDNGCHAFDIVCFLFGPIVGVRAVAMKRLQPIAVEDSVSVQVRAADGVVGRVDLSWSLSTGRDVYVSVYGSRGVIEIGWQGARLKLGSGPWQPVGDAYDKLDAHRRMLAAFVAATTRADQRAIWISAVECLRTVATVEAAYRSLESGAWESVQPTALRWERSARPRATPQRALAQSDTRA
jgi:predicted dehydrogenase